MKCGDIVYTLPLSKGKKLYSFGVESALMVLKKPGDAYGGKHFWVREERPGIFVKRSRKHPEWCQVCFPEGVGWVKYYEIEKAECYDDKG